MNFLEQAQPAIEELAAALGSEAALLAYSWVAVGLLVTLSITIGIHRFFQAEASLDDQLRSILNKPGPNPTRRETIQRRRNARNEVLGAFARQLAVTAFFVMGIPLVALAIVSVASDWFFSGQHVFVDRQSGDPIPEPSFVQLGLFILDQLLKGALLDVMEVFRIELGSIENATTNWPYSGLVLGFRILLDVYAISMIAKLILTFRHMLAPLSRLPA